MGRLVQPVPQKFRIPYFHTMGSSSLLPQQDGQTGRSQFPFNISGGGGAVNPLFSSNKEGGELSTFWQLDGFGLDFSHYFPFC